MRSLNIGVVLLLIAALIIADNSVIDQNEQHIRTRRDTTSFNETEMANITATADGDDNDDDDVGVIYVCGDNTTDARCTCINETLDCHRGLNINSYSYFNHIKIKIRNQNFIAKIVNFRLNDVVELSKNEILPGHESTVEELDFYFNEIRRIEAGTFDKFTSLKKLNLQTNYRLKSINDTILTKQLGSTLMDLDLTNTGLQNLSTTVFQHLSKLSFLSLRDNDQINLITKINGINVTIFPEALSNLKTLNLAYCNLKTFEENVFINLRSLEKLDISGNLISTVPKAIKMLSNLRYLDLMSSFQLLSVNDCDFCNLSNLKTVAFDHSYRLSFFDENAFGALNNGSTVPQLEEFSLKNCNVSVLSEKLINFKNISKIDIRSNSLTCNCSMAWLINDYNSTNPLIVDKMIDYSNYNYKNDLRCYSPSSFYGTHLHTLAGDFCSNKSSAVDIKNKDDGIYYVCKENDEDVENSNYFKGCFCFGNTSLNCDTWRTTFKLNHTNIKVLKSNFTIMHADLSGNNITSLKKGKVLPGNEHTVNILNLQSNNISSIENGTFDNFTVLESANLGSNNLTNIDNVTFPSTMQYLSLQKNNLQKIPTNNFENLYTLDISGNPKIFLSTNAVFPKTYSNLAILALSSCNISTLPDNIFINLQSLQVLYLMNNPLTAIPTALNAISKNLNSLVLSGHNITVFQQNGLNVFKNITHLVLGGSLNLEKIEDCAFCNFPNLQRVDLSFSKKLSYIHDNAFGAITNENAIQINSFLMKSCNITTLSEKLLNWQNASRINIEDNPLTCNCSMAWLINDYNTTTPFYVNNLKNQWSDESSKNELYCTNPPELKNEYLYKLSGDFCLNETLEAEKEEEIVYEVCKGNENEEIVDESDSCECKDENLKCTLLETTNVEIINKTIEIKFIQINQANISKLNLKNMIPEKQHLIESLQFYHSNIGSIENGTFDNFTSLKTLDFHGNVLTTIDENALTKQLGSALLELDLTFNNLKNLSSTSFMFLTKLKILKLQGNYGISNSLTSEVFSKSLSSLEHLILSHCNITALKDDVFVNLKNLKFLGLSDNPITTFPSAAINSLSNLQVLEMDGTKITVLKHTGLKRNTNLRYLFAHSSELLQKIENCAFCSFPNLISADFSHSKNLTSIHENAFGLAHSHLITALQSFYVNDCNLTTLPEKLLNWTSLKGFGAKKNPFKCDCSNKWLIKLAKSMKLLHYQCQSPVEFKGKHLMELPDSFCNEIIVNTTTLNSEISTTTPATITVTEAASTFSTHRYWMLVLIILSVVLSLSIVGGYYYYNRKRRIIQIPKSNEGDEDLLEEDFDMY